MYDELAKRLREATIKADSGNEISESMYRDILQAADAIEELSRDLDSMNEANIALYGALPKWIPVTERLPEMYVPCLLYNASQPTMVGWRVDEKRFRIPGSFLPDHPTHWMPLPEPPKEE